MSSVSDKLTRKGRFMEEKCMKEKVMKEKLKYLEDGSLGDLLIVIDLQNVYLENQPWGCRDTMGAWKRIM